MKFRNKLIAIILLISLIFNSQAFVVFAENENNVSTEENKTTVEASEESENTNETESSKENESTSETSDAIETDTTESIEV